MAHLKKIADPDWSDLPDSATDACAVESSGMVPIGCLAHDPTERLALDIMRYLCASLATGDGRQWEAAHDIAENCLGLIDAPSLVARAASLLRAVRSERRWRFDFLPAHCAECREHITRCEAQLVGLIRLARKGPSERLDRDAASFAGRKTAPRIVLAASAMGVLLERYEYLRQGGETAAGGGSDRLH